MNEWFGSSWETIGFVALGTLAIYVTMLVGVRIAGRRTISQLSAFDAVVTVALGSTMASTALSSNASYVQGAAVIVTLLVLQVVLAAVRQRSSVARRILDFPAEAVVRDGTMTLPTSPLSSQLSRDELQSLLRQKGFFDLDGVRLVLLEPSGGISVTRDSHAVEAVTSVPSVKL